MDSISAKATCGDVKRGESSTDLAAAGESVLRGFLKSAKASCGGVKRGKSSTDLAAAGESVLREFLKSAKAICGDVKRGKSSTDLAAADESVLRGFLKTTVLFCMMGGAVMAGAEVGALIQQVSVYDFGKDPAALRTLEGEVLRSAGTAQAADIEKQLIAALASAQTLAAKDAFCRDLSVIGTAASAPALASLLLKPETAEMARYALERIPGQAATDALRKALPQAPAATKPGIVISLGRRKDAASTGALIPLLASNDARLAEAAAKALAHIGTPDSQKTLLAAKPGPAVADALLEIAEKSPGPAALPIYTRLQSSESEAVRMAAVRGMARVAGKQAVPVLLAALKSGTPRVQAVAVRELAAIDRASLIRETSSAPVGLRIQTIAALSDSGQADVLPVLEQGLSSDAAPVRIAALNGLAKIGTAKQIPTLAARAAQTSEEEQAAARAALASIRGDEADQAILSAIPTADAKTKTELIRATGDRGIRTAPPVLMKTATDSNKAVRAESIRALRETAGPQQAAGLLALLVKTEDENERKEYERAVASAIRRSKDAPVDELTSAYKGASDTDVRASLLSVMAAVGNNDSLPMVRDAMKSSDADVQRAAINALAAWPSAEPANDLLSLAQSSANPAQQVLALRGYVKLVQIPSNRTPAETAKLLESAMNAAKRPDEKKLVLAAAQRVVCTESLELVKKSLDDPAVAAEAKQAATALERGLSYRRN